MKFSEQPPSKEWAALKFRGERIAEVWFKPEGEPCALAFRIPVQSFQLADIGQRLTTENLLKAVGIANEEVESWHHDGVSPADDAGGFDLAHPLPPPQQETYLNVHVQLKAQEPVVAHGETGEAEVPPEKWQEIEARWNAILVLEASMDSLRLSMEGLRAEMESASRHALATEEKQHALSADMAQWNQLKSRLVYALPKVREFIHRSIWSLGTPERKSLEEFFKTHGPADVRLTRLAELHRHLDSLLKERQVLSAQGTTVYQDGKRMTADVQGALRTLRSNAATNASRKKSTERLKRKKG